MLDSITKAIKECHVEKDPVFEEVQSHATFCHQKAETVIGRDDILQQIETYTSGGSRKPLVVYGESGSGKTSVMAKAVLNSRVSHFTCSRFNNISVSMMDRHKIIHCLASIGAP